MGHGRSDDREGSELGAGPDGMADGSVVAPVRGLTTHNVYQAVAKTLRGPRARVGQADIRAVEATIVALECIGWRYPPRKITSLVELEYLPDGTVFRDKMGDVGEIRGKEPNAYVYYPETTPIPLHGSTRMERYLPVRVIEEGKRSR